ncbi:hypothetical protein PTKIN_Ptkin10aG0079000 [Pterospermum kingtungense]
MKNASRNKLLLCFRPVVDMDLMLESKAVSVDRCQNHQALRHLGVQNKEDMKPSTSMSSVSETKTSIMIRRNGKRTFSQVIKAVVCEIILAKRIRDRKAIDQELYSPKLNFSLSSRDKLLDTNFDKSVNKVLPGKGIQDTIYKSNSISSISSSPNSAQKNERQLLQNNCNTYTHHRECEMKPKQKVIDRGSSSNSAIFLLLITLAMTIFWGKFYAILFTTIFLYFIPCQRPIGVCEDQGNIERSPEKKSRDYKRVIMEGLLQRNHNRGALNF